MSDVIWDLKTWPEYFEAVLSGEKTFEVRTNDKLFEVGDILNLREYSQGSARYTERGLKVRISYILREGPFAFPGYVIMAIKPVEE